MSTLADFVQPVASATMGVRRVGTSPAWIVGRFPVYARACLLAAIFVAPAALNIGSLNVFMLVKITSIWIFAVLALGFWVAASAEQRAWLPPMALARPAVVFLAVDIAATILSTNPRLSLVGLYARYGGLLPMLLYAAVALMIVGLYWRRPDGAREVAWAVTAGAAVTSGYVLIQAAGLDWAGWTDPASGQPPSFPGGTIGNSNFAGGYLAVALPFVAYTAAAATRRGVRVGLATVLGLTALALWCTQTRGGLVGATAGVATLALLYRHRFPRWFRRSLAAGLASLVAVVALAVWYPGGSDEAPGPLSEVRVLSTSTLENRVSYWWAAGSMFLDHPVLGVGPDMYFDHYSTHRRDKVANEGDYVVPEKPHNIFLEYAANTGAMGLVTYLALVALVLHYGWRRAHHLAGRKRLLPCCAIASLVAYLVQGFFSIDVPPLQLMGWVSLGVIAVLADPRIVGARQGNDQAGARAPRPRWAARASRTALAGSIIGLLFVGTLPMRADVIARSGNLARAIRMNPLESSYRAQAGARALQLAEAAQTPAQQQEALEKALQRYRQGLDMRPGGLEYLLGMAKTYTLWARILDPTKFAEATAWWRRTMAQDPRNDSLRRNYEDQEDAQRRVAGRLEAALQVRPDRVGDLITLAQVYIGLGEPGRARPSLEAALRLEPDNRQVAELLEGLPGAQPRR